MDESNLLTPGQVAGLLSISTRTLRRWSVAFESALSPSARRRGRKRSYSAADVDTLRQAQRELNQPGRTLALIAPGLPVVDPDAPAGPLALSPEQNLVLGGMVERSARLSESVSDHDDRLADLEAFLREPWWRRLFGSPPRK